MASQSLQDRDVSRFRRFRCWLRQHKLGGVGLGVLILLVFIAIFSDFLSPYSPRASNEVQLSQTLRMFSNAKQARYVSPIDILRNIHVFDETGLHWPYMCALIKNKETPSPSYSGDCSQKNPIRFFVRNPNYEYSLFGIFKTNVHLFGVTEPQAPLFFGTVTSKAYLFLLGTDGQGRDLFSRILVGTKASLGISFVAAILSLIIALILGMVSGYLGGVTDTLIQRVIEVVLTFPRLALLLIIAVSIKDPFWRLIWVIFLLALFNSASLGRILRGQVLAIREADYIEAARAQGAGHTRILFRHIIPQVISTIVISTALAIPNLLVLESFLSYLGYGTPPQELPFLGYFPSWGLLLKEISEGIPSLPFHPWMLFPVGAIFLVVLACTFLGDALRDWFDPFSQK